LGNFTINHYTGIRVATDAVVIDHVTDFAEIPTFSERQAMDADGDGTISAAESADYQLAACNGLASTLRLTAGESALTLAPIATGLHFAPGAGSDVMRLVCVLRAKLALPAAGATLTFNDPTFAGRRGWREIVVQGDAATISESDVDTAGVSARLTAYPSDLLSLPLEEASATFTVRPGGPPLPALTFPDSTLIGTGAPLEPPTVEVPAAQVPGGTTDLGADVTALFQSPDLTPPIILLSLLVALGLGALHALSPGHGKTVMAAYLVGSRGNARQAIGLGLTVTVSHTLGVLALGLLSLSAAAILPPERLYPILSVASGAIVVVIGAYLLITRVRAWRAESRGTGQHHDEHHHEHEDHQRRPEGWHEHDGMGHTHLPQPRAMGRRGLFALGLSGGMIPSVSALLVLIGSISIGRPAWGIVLTIAFGLGMAAVLVGVGIALVHARKLVERLPVAGTLRFGQRLPVLTAAVVLVAGLLIAGQGLAGLG
ncbi:MAG TPA: hypothetical protein VM284_04605, partial [Candidatus Limnocylindria bacterium]|nr:hypothetical protein [Candidatus Limnocylindria bacterium]